MERDYSAMTSEEYDDILNRLVAKMHAAEVLQVPGCYEALSEELNNKVLDVWAEEHPITNTTDEEEE